MNMLNKLKKEDTLELRSKYVPSCVQLYFSNDPLKIVKGEGQYMFDDKGNKYLDCINNVAHVGHCHPHVVSKTHEQAGLLETNSRFLHDNLVIYCQRLSAYLPKELDKFVFVNSGSESNDLALRISRRATGAYDVIVLDHAYHGHLTSLIDISPYKFNGNGGEGKPEFVHVAPVPDIYRGKYRSSEYPDEDKLCDLYVQEVVRLVEIAESKNRKIAIFLAESFQSCGGQIIYPRNYFRKVYKYLQSKGILCLADEVQCGYFRSGTHMWAFQTQGEDLVPDFVTIGKSMGNGHPVACLVTKSELAEKFGKNNLQYFNTYGGNPVSAAVANAVLDVLENEKLHQHVTSVSNYLLNKLNDLKNKYEIIGDVRGYGYFIGVDFVLNRRTREPAIEQAKMIVNNMRYERILLSLDGPFSNVMKIKPPLKFNKDDVELLINTLDKILNKIQVSSKI